MTAPDKRELVKEAYGQVARQQLNVLQDQGSCACGCSNKAYVVPDHPVPQSELGLSCGNPVAFGHIQPGDVVLDLGSGAGKDVFLAAQRVGPAGRAIGVDMTPEMLQLARRNAEHFRKTTGLGNVEFRQGHIEELPVENGSVDVAISNCVINLSPDKPRVFREIARVLKPGGRMIVSDIVLNRPIPQDRRDDAALYAACIAGALLREEYLLAVRAAGFSHVEVLSDQTYRMDTSCCNSDPITSQAGDLLDGAAATITVLARK